MFAQLSLLPDTTTRLTYLAISQLLGGFFIGVVVTFNHNSVDKFPRKQTSDCSRPTSTIAEHSRLLNNFAALHILTTRNLKPSVFSDWSVALPQNGADGPLALQVYGRPQLSD